MPVQSAVSSVAFSDVMLAIKARIVAGVDLATESSVQIVCAPDDDMPDYLMQPGFRLRPHPPVPRPESGAGRHAYLCDRLVECYVVTQNLSDPGGQDDTAVLAHLDVEDQVLDALTLDHPSRAIAIVKFVKWVPGGSPITRMLRVNPGLVVSVLPFVVSYIPPLKVNRE